MDSLFKNWKLWLESLFWFRNNVTVPDECAPLIHCTMVHFIHILSGSMFHYEVFVYWFWNDIFIIIRSILFWHIFASVMFDQEFQIQVGWNWSECHLLVFCIDPIVSGFVVYYVNFCWKPYRSVKCMTLDWTENRQNATLVWRKCWRRSLLQRRLH